MTRLLLLPLALVLAAAEAPPSNSQPGSLPGSQGASLQVVVTGVKDASGRVRVAACTRAEFLHPHCALHASAPAHPGETAVTIAGVPPGIYAVQAWHDANDNGEIDRNFLGIPRESMGFSRDARIRFGPPRFDDAAIQTGSSDARITFPLHGF